MILSNSLAACLKVLICFVLIFLMLEYHNYIQIKWKFKCSNGKSKRRQDNLLLETSFNLTVAHHLMVSNLGCFANSSRRMVNFEGIGLYSIENF